MSRTLSPILRSVQRRLIRNAEDAGRSWDLEGSPVLETLLDDRNQLDNLQSFLEEYATETPELLKVGPRRLVLGMGQNVGKIDLYPSPVNAPTVQEKFARIMEDLPPEGVITLRDPDIPTPLSLRAAPRRGFFPIHSSQSPMARAEVYAHLLPTGLPPRGYSDHAMDIMDLTNFGRRYRRSRRGQSDLWDELDEIRRMEQPHIVSGLLKEAPEAEWGEAPFESELSRKLYDRRIQNINSNSDLMDQLLLKINRNLGKNSQNRIMLLGMRDYPFRY